MVLPDQASIEDGRNGATEASGIIGCKQTRYRFARQCRVRYKDAGFAVTGKGIGRLLQGLALEGQF